MNILIWKDGLLWIREGFKINYGETLICLLGVQKSGKG